MKIIRTNQSLDYYFINHPEIINLYKKYSKLNILGSDSLERYIEVYVEGYNEIVSFFQKKYSNDKIMVDKLGLK